INKVPDVPGPGSLDRLAGRGEVDGTELSALRGTRVRDAYQVHQSVAAGEMMPECPGVERVAGHRVASGREPGLRSRAGQTADIVTTGQEFGAQAASEVSGSAGDEDRGHS